jgi:hypothetical protein
MSENKSAKVIDLNARRILKKPKRVRCLTILQDEPRRTKLTLREATPEEYADASWTVGPFHRAPPRAPKDQGG